MSVGLPGPQGEAAARSDQLVTPESGRTDPAPQSHSPTPPSLIMAGQTAGRSATILNTSSTANPEVSHPVDVSTLAG